MHNNFKKNNNTRPIIIQYFTSVTYTYAYLSELFQKVKIIT